MSDITFDGDRDRLFYIPLVTICEMAYPLYSQIGQCTPGKTFTDSLPPTRQIEFGIQPRMMHQKESYRKLQRAVSNALYTQPDGGGVIVEVHRDNYAFSSGRICGAGRSCEVAIKNYIREAGESEETKIDSDIFFFWICRTTRKPAIKPAVAAPKPRGKRRVTAFSGTLWFRSGESQTSSLAHNSITIGLRG